MLGFWQSLRPREEAGRAEAQSAAVAVLIWSDSLSRGMAAMASGPRGTDTQPRGESETRVSTAKGARSDQPAADAGNESRRRRKSTACGVRRPGHARTAAIRVWIPAPTNSPAGCPTPVHPFAYRPFTHMGQRRHRPLQRRLRPRVSRPTRSSNAATPGSTSSAAGRTARMKLRRPGWAVSGVDAFRTRHSFLMRP